MRRTAATAATLLVGLFAVVGPAAPAAAHTRLATAVPAAKATVTRPVTQVTLTFSGLVKRAGTQVEVVGADGRDVRTGDVRVLDKTVTAPISPPPLGAVTVRWRTVSSDGHALTGSYAFTNKAAAPVATPTPTPTPTPAATAVAVVPISRESGPATGAVAATVVAAVVVVGGLAGLVRWRRRAKPE